MPLFFSYAMNTDKTIAELADLFASQGDTEYVGEPVTQLQHALQTAHLAEQAGADPETVVAAFLHDMGHLLPPDAGSGFMDGYGTIDHERLAANYLRQRGFSDKVTRLIENHVNAKRYLVFKHPAYLASLSEASLKTLSYQGGPMTADEATHFEQHPHFAGILQLRRWDEQAKLVEAVTPDAAYYLEVCRKVTV